MKVEGIHDGRLYGSSNRSLYEETAPLSFDAIGTLPDPTTGWERLRYRFTTTWPWTSLTRAIVGNVHTVNAWRISSETILANANRWVFRSDDGGGTWQHVLTLPETAGLRGIMPGAFAMADGCLYLGEYLSAYDGTPRVLVSDDGGRSWVEFLALPDVRHVHAIEPDPFAGGFWITTGDTDQESRMYHVRDETAHVVGSGSQMWRTVALEVRAEAIYWGMDCAYANRNDVLRLGRDEIGEETATPSSVHDVRDALYYSAGLTDGSTSYLFFSTGGGIRTDSTAPDDVEQERGAVDLEVWGASSRTDFSEWSKVVEYSRKKSPLETFGVDSYAANAYVFLHGSDDRGLFINPFNTAGEDGEIEQLRPAELREIVP